jgi:hypothetical protein
MTELEIKHRNLQNKYDKDMKKIDDTYKDKLNNLSKSLQNFEDIIINSRQNSSKNLFNLSYIKAKSGMNSFIEEEELDSETVKCYLTKYQNKMLKRDISTPLIACESKDNSIIDLNSIEKKLDDVSIL